VAALYRGWEHAPARRCPAQLRDKQHLRSYTKGRRPLTGG